MTLRWTIGDVTITRVLELEQVTVGPDIWPNATRENLLAIPGMEPYFVTPEGDPLLSYHSLCVEVGDRRIIVDTCIGNDKERRLKAWSHLQTDYLDAIAAAGFERTRVDTILCTHMHSDHVGWNTMLVDGTWVPTFPNATYLVSEPEYRYWTTDAPQKTRERFGTLFEDSIDPVVDAGLLKPVPEDAYITDEIWLEPTPGHTPAHSSVWISSRGETALITGDCFHHPFQIAQPDWASHFEYDRDQANATRHRLLDRLADDDVLVLGSHFMNPTAGHVHRTATGHHFEPQEQPDV